MNKINSNFYQTYEEVKAWLDNVEIDNYIIHDDLKVDVQGDVSIVKKNIHYFPVQFGTINWSFDCRFNNLKSLKGAPLMVQGAFLVAANPLENFDYLPSMIGDRFSCSGKLELKDLINCKFKELKHECQEDEMIDELKNKYTFVKSLNIYTLQVSQKRIQDIMSISKEKEVLENTVPTSTLKQKIKI